MCACSCTRWVPFRTATECAQHLRCPADGLVHAHTPLRDAMGPPSFYRCAFFLACVSPSPPFGVVRVAGKTPARRPEKSIERKRGSGRRVRVGQIDFYWGRTATLFCATPLPTPPGILCARGSKRDGQKKQAPRRGVR